MGCVKLSFKKWSQIFQQNRFFKNRFFFVKNSSKSTFFHRTLGSVLLGFNFSQRSKNVLSEKTSQNDEFLWFFQLWPNIFFSEKNELFSKRSKIINKLTQDDMKRYWSGFTLFWQSFWLDFIILIWIRYLSVPKLDVFAKISKKLENPKNHIYRVEPFKLHVCINKWVNFDKIWRHRISDAKDLTGETLLYRVAQKCIVYFVFY